MAPVGAHSPTMEWHRLQLRRLLGIAAQSRQCCVLSAGMVALGLVSGAADYLIMTMAARMPHMAVNGDATQLWESSKVLAVAYALRVVFLNLPYFWLKRWSVVAWRQHLNTVLVRRFLHSGLYLLPVSVDTNDAPASGADGDSHLRANGSTPRGIANPAARIRDDVESFLGRWSMVLSAKLFNVLSALPNLWVVYSTFGGWAVAFIFALVATVYRVTNMLMADAVANERQRNTATASWKASVARVVDNSEAVALVGSYSAERSQIDKAIVSVEAVTRRLLWRRLPSQLWSKLFHVSPPQVALGITAIQLWVIPRLVTTWPAVAQAMGTKLSFAGIDAQTEAARSEAVTMTVLSVCSVMSAFVAIVRTYSDLDVSFAAASRIMNMVDAMDACEAMNRKHATQAAGVLRRGTAVAVTLDSVTFADPTGTVLARNVNLHLQQGQRLLITGPSGSGKTSLLRVLAGLWPLQSGTVELPSTGVFFVPKVPYLISGSLRRQIMYPVTVGNDHNPNSTTRRHTSPSTPTNLRARAPSHEELREVLERARLSHLLLRCDPDDVRVDWDHILSVGERQRLALARVLWHQPQCAVLDESTSALDPAMQDALYRELISAGTTLISVAHRVRRWHDLELHLHGPGDGSEPGCWTVRAIHDQLQDHRRRRAPVSPDVREGDEGSQSRTCVDGKAPALRGVSPPVKHSAPSVYSLAHLRQAWSVACMVLPASWWKRGVLVSGLAVHALLVAGAIAAKGYVSAWAREALVVGHRDQFLTLLPLAAVTALARALVNVAKTYTQDRVKVAALVEVSRRGTRVLVQPRVLARICHPVKEATKAVVGTTNDPRPPAPASRPRSAATLSASQPALFLRHADARLTHDGARAVTTLCSCLFVITEGLVALVVWTFVFQNWEVLAKLVGGLVLMMLVRNGLLAAVSLRAVPLVRAEAQASAAARAAVARIATYAESIAFYGGEDEEFAIVAEHLERARNAEYAATRVLLVEAWIACVFRNIRRAVPTFVPAAVVVATPVDVNAASVPAVEHVVERLTYRQVTVIGDAAAQMQEHLASLNTLRDTYSGGLPHIMRLHELVACATQAQADKTLSWAEEQPCATDTRGATPPAIECDRVSIGVPYHQQDLVGNLTVSLRHDSAEPFRWLLQGPSGCGKSTVVRVIAGMWPMRRGIVRVPRRGYGGLAIVPQTIHLPPGSLRHIIQYPLQDFGDRGTADSSSGNHSARWDNTLCQLLHLLGLAHLLRRSDPGGVESSTVASLTAGLDAVAPWERVLSGGEAQRIGLARVLLSGASIVVLDEATSALDEEWQTVYYSTLRDCGLSYVSVAHAPGVRDFHDMCLVFTRQSQGTNNDSDRVGSRMELHQERIEAAIPPAGRNVSPHPNAARAAGGNAGRGDASGAGPTPRARVAALVALHSEILELHRVRQQQTAQTA